MKCALFYFFFFLAFFKFTLVPPALFTVCQGVKAHMDGRPGWLHAERLLTGLSDKSQALTCSLAPLQHMLFTTAMLFPPLH